LGRLSGVIGTPAVEQIAIVLAGQNNG